MVRILGSTGTRRRRRYQLGALVSLVALLALIAVPNALAVHETGIFQLDGNAQTSVQPPSPYPQAREDWDQVCSALLTTLTPPGTCPQASNYTLPSYGTLAAAIDSSQTTITVTETTTPPAVPFIIRIDSEEMRVTARAPGTPATYTVVRGYNSAAGSSPRGGPAAAHASGATVFAITIGSPVSFVGDPFNSKDDDILKGGTKDDNPVGSWRWATAGSLDKNDIANAFAAEYTCNDTSVPNGVPNCDSGHAGHKILIFGGDRLSNNGSANLAFWFFQKRVQQLTADGTPVGTAGVDTCTLNAGCLFQGEHVAGTFNPDGTVNTPGDILIISAFGPHAQLQVFMWVGTNNAPTPCFTNACSLVPLIPITAGVECGVATADNACSKVNDATIPSPWTISQKNPPKGTAANSILATDFYEGGIDLNQLGLTGACFSTFLMNTRASSSGDAELHDKVIGSFQHCAPALATQASNNATNIPQGTPVYDTATVTVSGATSPDDAAGTVQFYLCGPIATGGCTSTTNAIGSPVTLNNADCVPPSGSDTDGISCAKSVSVNTSAAPLDPGRYCFGASAALTNYDNPDAVTSETNECFAVQRFPSRLDTAPWIYPNDKATVYTAAGDTSTDITGSVSFRLFGATTSPAATALANCTNDDGTNAAQGLLYRETVSLPATAATSKTVNTSNPGTTGTPTSVKVESSATVYWRVSYGGDTLHFGRNSTCVENINTTLTGDTGGTAPA